MSMDKTIHMLTYTFLIKCSATPSHVPTWPRHTTTKVVENLNLFNWSWSKTSMPTQASVNKIIISVSISHCIGRAARKKNVQKACLLYMCIIILFQSSKRSSWNTLKVQMRSRNLLQYKNTVKRTLVIFHQTDETKHWIPTNFPRLNMTVGEKKLDPEILFH